jgi:hypothetical protein
MTDYDQPTSQLFRKILRVKYEDLKYFQDYFNDVIVFYTMNGCHWCTKAQPDVEEASLTGNGKNPVLQIILQDNPGLSKLANLEGFPTIRRYTKGSYKEYEGPRTLKGFIEFFS